MNVYSFFYKVPPGPANDSNLARITKTQHDMFTVELKPSLLNNKNGPITAWGVLVTSDISRTFSFLSYCNIDLQSMDLKCHL